ncbi:MAG: hypothetical protein FK730_06530 [Asgard group archaeon]|nr:hypothetical protein [Asgard group archaeon]
MSYYVISNEIPFATIENLIEGFRFKGRGIFRKKPTEKLSYIKPLLWPVLHFEISYSTKGDSSRDDLSAVRNFMLGNFSLPFIANVLKNDGGRKALSLIFSREKQDILQSLSQFRSPHPSLQFHEPADIYHQLFKYYSDYRTSLEKQLDQTILEMEPLYAEANNYQKKFELIREKIANFSGDKKSPEYRDLRSLRSEYQKQARQLRKHASSTISRHEKDLQLFIRKWSRGQRRFLGLKKNAEIIKIGVLGTFYYQYWVARLDSSSSTRYIVINKDSQQVRKLQNMLNFDANLRNEVDTALQFKKFIGETNCFFCGTSIGKSDATCSNCSKEVMKCSVCKLTISQNDQIASCPKCDSKAHLSHLHEWIKTQGKCPTCLQEVKLRNLILNIDDQEEKEN